MVHFVAFAQDPSQTVRGKVTDTDSEVPVPYANVVIIGSEPLIGAATDFDGNFKLEKVPIGRHNIKISVIGYEDVYVSEIMVGTGREVVMEVKMTEAISELSEVTVTAKNNPTEAINQMAVISANQISVESTSRVAAGINDPGRTAQSFAGVSSADDENNELVVRGNSPRGVLWRMEGIEIPNPNHFGDGEGSSGGGVSALSTQVLANSDFLTGAFPAEYGNALSGVFDLQLRKGNSEKREYSAQLGVLGLQASMEGPFSKKSEASYLVNYRYSTLRLISLMGIDISGGNIAPGWQDLSYKVFVPTKKAGRFSIWGLGGISDAGNNAIRDTSVWEYRGDAFEEMEKHYLGVAGLTHNYVFKNMKTYMKTVVAFTHTTDHVTEDTLDFEFNKTAIDRDKFSYNTVSVSSFVNHKFNAKTTLRAGAIYHNKSFNFNSEELNFNTGSLERLIDTKGNTSIAEAYIQAKHRINEKLEITPGVHYTHLFLNHSYSIEPRLGFKWSINKRHSISVGSGMHSKIEPISVYLAEKELPDGSIIRPNENLGLTKAVHAILGYNWSFAKNTRLKVEFYYQHLYEVPVSLNDTTNTQSALNFRAGYTNEAFANKGQGRNYGVELTIDKFFARNWYLLFTTSLFESKYTMPDGVERNTLFNTNYILNLVGGKEFKVGKKKLNVIGTNVRLMWRGGYRTIPIDLDASLAQNEEVRKYDEAFTVHAPDYVRLDVGINYRGNLPKWSWEVSLNVQNVINRMNVLDEYYNPVSQELETATMVGLVPILNLKFEF